MAYDCKSNIACVYCGECNQHNRSLCPQKFKSKQNVETRTVSLSEEGVCEEISSMSGENAMVPVGESVVMQAARQRRNTLRHVPLLPQESFWIAVVS